MWMFVAAFGLVTKTRHLPFFVGFFFLPFSSCSALV